MPQWPFWILGIAVGYALVRSGVFRSVVGQMGGQSEAEGNQGPESSDDTTRVAAVSPADEFSGFADRFQGLFEPLVAVTEDRARQSGLREEIISEWESRLRRYKLSATIKEWERVRESLKERYSQVEHAREWYRLLQSWGIKRDQSKELIFDKQVAAKYDVDGTFGTDYREGDKLTVIRPCWEWGTFLLERGLANKAGG
jgi:hypothetical protein